MALPVARLPWRYSLPPPTAGGRPPPVVTLKRRFPLGHDTGSFKGQVNNVAL